MGYEGLNNPKGGRHSNNKAQTKIAVQEQKQTVFEGTTNKPGISNGRTRQ